MNEHRVLSYEKAASIQSVSGWVCETCQRYYGNQSGSEHLARKCCCKDFKCEKCDNRIEGDCGYFLCKMCRDIDQWTRYRELEKEAWDGESPLYSDKYDKWFIGSDIENQIYEFIQEPPPGWKYGDPECVYEINEDVLMDLQLLICEEMVKQSFDAQDYWNGDLAEDQEIDDVEEINSVVNKWAAENLPATWVPTKYAVDLSSLNIERQE